MVKTLNVHDEQQKQRMTLGAVSYTLTQLFKIINCFKDMAHCAQVCI